MAREGFGDGEERPLVDGVLRRAGSVYPASHDSAESASLTVMPAVMKKPFAVPVRVAVPLVAIAVAMLVTAAGPGSLYAASVEPARVRMAGRLIDDVVRGLLPLDLVLPGATQKSADGGVTESAVGAALTDLRYCGVTDRGAGRFRAVIRMAGPSGGGTVPSPSVLTGDEGCRKSLNDLANPATATATADSPGTQDVVVADVEAIWRPWELRLTIIRTSSPSPPKPGPPRPLGGLDGHRDLFTISTSGFRIVTDAGQAIVFHVAPAFAVDAIELGVILGEGGAVPRASRSAMSGPALVLSGDATVAADLPYAFANQILRQLTQAEPFPIQVDRDVVDLQNASVSGSSGGMTLTGTATPRSVRESVRLTVQAGGADLRVAAVRSDAQLEDCGGLGVLAAIGCNARNAGRNVAAGAFASAMTQKYQGQLVRALAGTQGLRFELENRRLELRGDLLHLASSPRGLWAVARFTPGDQSH